MRWMNGALLLPLLGLGACGRPSQLQLILTPTPEVAPEADIVGQVERLAVVVGSQQGLSGVASEGPTAGGGDAKDYDGDGRLEVLFHSPKVAGRLPVLQINLEANAGRALSFLLYGLPEPDAPLTDAVALGVASGTCEAGKTCQVGVPFNLKPSLAAPRVILVSPPDDPNRLNPVSSQIIAVSAILSTLVDADSARAHARVLGPSGKVASVKVMVDEVALSLGGETARRTNLTFQLEPPLETGLHTIEIGPGLVSAAGRRFDQNPATVQEDGFKSAFVAKMAPAANGCHCERGYVCNQKLFGCQPAASCPASCVAAYVCDPAQQVCVEDCRVLSVCPSACDQGSGLCR